MTYHIETEDFYKDIADDCPTYFDTSNYAISKGNIKLGLNKKIPGLVKDETGDRKISHFVGNRPKFYCYVIDHDFDGVKQVLKGIKASVWKEITYDD